MNKPEMFLLVLFVCACCGACLAWWKIKILNRPEEGIEKELEKNNKSVEKERLK